MEIHDLWYKDAVIYCLDVGKYMDVSGSGIGDFRGLGRRLRYLSSIGVTCIWLLPFYKTPNRDNGYDVSDYYSVDPMHGTLGHFVEVVNMAKSLGIRVLVDLVVSHTSIEHPWFQSARKGPGSPYYDWYIWADERPANHADGIVFPGVQTTNWTYDDEAGQYYFHRFYDFQADLNTHHPAVRDEIKRIMGFWTELGVSGFRLDAVPFLIERKGVGVKPEKDYELLHEMRDFLQWRCKDAILLAEANVPPDESMEYFGERGDNLQMMLNFPVNQRLFYALATADTKPLRWALEQTAVRPKAAQWVQFLRSHDELDLGRLTEEQRQATFAAFGPEEEMQLYGRGIRRRLAPMLNNDQRRLRMANSLLFSLPGTPMLQYGDEIGMGDDLELPERECARTAMQWSTDRHGGFSLADEVGRDAISGGEYGYQKVNVAHQRFDPESPLNFIHRLIRARRECPEIARGESTILDSGANELLAIRYDWRGASIVTIHNFANGPRTVRIAAKDAGDESLFDVFRCHRYEANAQGLHEFEIDAYGFCWLRPGCVDNVIHWTST